MNTSSDIVNNSIFENAAIGLIVVDEEGKFEDINQFGLEMVGKKKEDVLGLSGGKVFQCVNAVESGKSCGQSENCKFCSIKLCVQETYENGTSICRKESALNVVVGNDIMRLYLLISTTVIDSPDGRKVLMTVDDVSKHKTAEEELIEVKASKAKLFSILSENLKIPFVSLLGYSELLLKSSDEFDEIKTKQLLQSINDSSKLTYNLLDNLLLWARIQTNRMQFFPSNILLKEVVQKRIEALQDAADNKNITVFSELDDGAFVYADANMLNIILNNLLSNAIKFTPNEGMVIVSCKQTEDNTIELSIIDNGVGMSSGDIERLFKTDDYYTTRGTNNEKGAGLGLILAKEFMEKHDGEILVESEKGKGSRFTIELKMA